MPGNYKIEILSSGTWIVPSTSPDPNNPADLVLTIDCINGSGLKPNTPSQNITGTISLVWLPATAPLQAQVTIPKDVLFGADRTKLQAAWEQFLTALDSQEGTNNYMQPAGARTTAFLLAQNMPMLLTELSYYNLRFGSSAQSGHYIDLQPGMRLMMSYGNYFNEAHSGSGQQLKSFSVSGESFVDIQSDYTTSGLLFNPFMALQNTSVQSAVNVVPPKLNVQVAANVVDLASQPVKPYHRLFYPVGANSFTGADTASLSAVDSVSLVSCHCYGSLAAAPGTQPVTEACNPLYPKIYPTVFFGRCIITVQLVVRINGKTSYVSAGTTVNNIIETAQPVSSQPLMLRINRYLNGDKASIIYPAGNTTAAMDMTVLQGDEVIWLSLGDFQLVERLQAIYRITSPAPDALSLGRLGITSFGDISVYSLPGADNMALALLQSHDKPSTYTAPQIGIALFTIYNATPFTDAYTGGQLAYSLYFAGFDSLDVAAGVVAGYTPVITMQTGGILVGFLLFSGIGYTVTEIANGVFQSLDSSKPENAYYLVQSLIEGSLQFGQSYTPAQVAEGVCHAITYTSASAFQLAAALMQGSSIAAPAKQEYAAPLTAAALFYAFNTTGIVLTQNDLAMALAKAFNGQPLGYPVDQVALGVFSVYPQSDATTIATALLNSGVNYTMNDVAKGTYAVKLYDPQPGHELSAEELANALYTAYGSAAENIPKNVAVALVYAINGVTANTVAAAVATVFGYLNTKPQYTQANINTIASAVTFAFTLSGTDQPSVNSAAAALLFAFTGASASELANGLVAGFQYTVSGTNLAAMSTTCNGVVSALAFDKSSQAQVTTTAGALQNAFQVNMQDQPCATTLAQSLVSGFNGILALTLATSLVQTGTYVKSNVVDVILPTQAAAIAMGYAATSQPQINTLVDAIKTSMGLDGTVQNDVNYLSRAIARINTTVVSLLINGTSLQVSFSYSGTSQTDINLFSVALTYGYTLNASLQTDVTNLCGAIVQVFVFVKTSQTQVAATGNGLVACFGFQSSSQPNINSVAVALVSTFNYAGYSGLSYLKADAQFIGGVLQTVFNGITITQMLPSLRSGFTSFLPVDAGSILTSLYQLNINSATDIATLGGLIGNSYAQLSTAPYGVASVSLCVFSPGFAYLVASGWIAKWYQGWTGSDFTIFNNVYNTPIWAQALVLINSRQTPSNMAVTLQQGYDGSHALADEMVQTLAACYNYIDASVSVIPVGTAMKAAGYSLIQTSGAMGNGQYKSQWSITYYNQLVAIFTGTTLKQNMNQMTTSNTSSKISLAEIVSKGLATDASRLTVALGCRIGGNLDPIECAPTLYNYTDPSGPNPPNAIQLSTVLMIAWGGIITPAILTSALQTISAYTPTAITAAVTNQYTLNFLDSYVQPTAPLAAVGLYQGNLVTLSSGEAVTYLVISCMPGDYAPTPGSMIAALAAVGVNVGTLAQTKAADYLSTYHCWVSQLITGQSFTRLLVLEASAAGTVGWIPGLFTALQTFATAQQQTDITIASAMLSTGSVGADPSQVLTALFTGAKTLMSPSPVGLYACKLVNYNASWNAALITTFDSLKTT
ncbi:MAG: hypothetical protein V4450_00070 [Bacteroidota bacterium]